MRLSDPVRTGEAVLAWAVAGARRLTELDGPLADPEVVVQATQEHRDDQAPTAFDAWLEECCATVSDDIRTTVTDLRDSYESWCARTGTLPQSVKAWGTDMRQLYKSARTSTTRFYRGVTLVAAAGEVDPTA